MQLLGVGKHIPCGRLASISCVSGRKLTSTLDPTSGYLYSIKSNIPHTVHWKTCTIGTNAWTSPPHAGVTRQFFVTFKFQSDWADQNLSHLGLKGIGIEQELKVQPSAFRTRNFSPWPPLFCNSLFFCLLATLNASAWVWGSKFIPWKRKRLKKQFKGWTRH